MKPRRQGVHVIAKTFEGYHCSYRAWGSNNHQDKILHPYSLTVKAIFESHNADERVLHDNSDLMREFRKILDQTIHNTVIVAHSDPELPIFKALETKGLINLIALQNVSASQLSIEFFNWLKVWLINSNAIDEVDIRAVEVTENDKSSYLYSE